MRNQDEVGGERRMELESSPIHRAVWESEVPMDLFRFELPAMPAAARAALDRSLDVVRRRRTAGTLYGADGIVSEETIHELADAGYWGLRAQPRHGGAGGDFATLARAITEMMVVDPWVAGMASLHAALGTVSSLEDFGTPEQRDRLTPPLARGERLGAFAITEPITSADWRRIVTTARRDGDQLLLTGEKLFISNALPGRTLSLLCWLDGRFEQVLVELPDHEDERFEIIHYSLRAPAHVANVGLRFRDLPVPAANLLVPHSGDGRTIAFRALNHGRVAVCAMAAGALRLIAGTLIPWVQERVTFGAPIGTRELVQRRLGRLAARIVGCDAMTAWGATLLDQGYRGELECVTAKVFGSEALADATISILLKTQGARSFLVGNVFADAIHDFLAPTIYEGENEILTFRFFTSLARSHGARYLDAIADAASEAGFARPDLTTPRALWAARRPLTSYASWLVDRQVRHLGASLRRTVPADAAGLAEVAASVLQGSALEISAMIRKHGAEAALRQARAHEIARRVQDATAMLVTSQHAARAEDPLVRDAAIAMAMELGHALLGVRPSNGYLRLLTNLGAAVAEDRFAPVASVERRPVAMAEHLPAREAPGGPREAPVAEAVGPYVLHP